MIIPGINSRDYEAAARAAKKISEFSDWAHLDVEDGVFTPNLTWGDPLEFKELRESETAIKMMNFEVHLMIQEPEKELQSWLGAGAKRVIIHLEAMSNPHFILETAKKTGKEVMLAISPPTAVEMLTPYLSSFSAFQILAVSPGASGQKFDEKVLEKIKFLREGAPDAIIEVDGGINPETAKLAREAGARVLVSTSYIMNSPDPASAFRALAEG